MWRRKQYRKTVRRNGVVDRMFQQKVKSDVEKIWHDGKIKNAEKVNHLKCKWRPKAAVEHKLIRNVKYSDEDLGADHDSKEDPPMYGNVEASENMKEALRTNPKFMTYEKIDILDCETRYELGFTKARYGLLNKENGDDDMRAWSQRG